MTAPTVVLVHGAFADASSYAPVTRALLDAGIAVLAPAVPNRGLTSDAAYVRAAISAIEGPVLLVGHSYGGAVITLAGDCDNVIGLLYLAGYALTEGESLAQMQGQFPDSRLGAALVQHPLPVVDHGPGVVDITVDPEQFFPVVAADADPRVVDVLAVSQRPLAAGAFTEPAPVAAWRNKPTWGVVCSADQAINPDVQRFGYQRAGATVTEIDSSHLVMLSQPEAVTSLIAQILQFIAN